MITPNQCQHPAGTPDLLNAREAAHLIGRDECTIRSALKRGQLRGERQSRQWRITHADLDAYQAVAAPQGGQRKAACLRGHPTTAPEHRTPGGACRACRDLQRLSAVGQREPGMTAATSRLLVAVDAARLDLLCWMAHPNTDKRLARAMALTARALDEAARSAREEA